MALLGIRDVIQNGGQDGVILLKIQIHWKNVEIENIFAEVVKNDII